MFTLQPPGHRHPPFLPPIYICALCLSLFSAPTLLSTWPLICPQCATGAIVHRRGARGGASWGYDLVGPQHKASIGYAQEQLFRLGRTRTECSESHRYSGNSATREGWKSNRERRVRRVRVPRCIVFKCPKLTLISIPSHTLLLSRALILL